MSRNVRKTDSVEGRGRGEGGGGFLYCPDDYGEPQNSNGQNSDKKKENRIES